jgi:hypothetical protein
MGDKYCVPGILVSPEFVSPEFGVPGIRVPEIDAKECAMTKGTIAFCVATFLGGCISTAASPEYTLVRKFSELENRVGRQVTIEGIISITQGASGIYFSFHDLRKQNSRCVALDPFVDRPHGRKLRLYGVIMRTGCGSEKICTNVCGDYILKLR